VLDTRWVWGRAIRGALPIFTLEIHIVKIWFMNSCVFTHMPTCKAHLDFLKKKKGKLSPTSVGRRPAASDETLTRFICVSRDYLGRPCERGSALPRRFSSLPLFRARPSPSLMSAPPDRAMLLPQVSVLLRPWVRPWRQTSAQNRTGQVRSGQVTPGSERKRRWRWRADASLNWK
jgi:hypothetical protein